MRCLRVALEPPAPAGCLQQTPADENLTTNTHSHITAGEVTTGVQREGIFTHMQKASVASPVF